MDGFISWDFKLTPGVWIPGLRQDGASRNDEGNSRELIPIHFQTAKSTHPRIPATRCVRVVALTSLEKRGRSATPRLPQEGSRECRTLGASAAACAVVESTRVSHHGHTGITRHSPRNGFNSLFRALPGDRAFLPPSPVKSHQLDASVGASGPHGFAVRKISAFVNAPPTSTASRSNVRDDRDTPLIRNGMTRLWK